MSMEETKALRLMGRVLTLSRLRVQSTNNQDIVEELTRLTLENPMLKQGLPVIIESQELIDLASHAIWSNPPCDQLHRVLLQTPRRSGKVDIGSG